VPADLPSNVPDEPPAHPEWVALLHRLRWPVMLVGLVVYGFIPTDHPRWLPGLIFFASIVGFWAGDVVDSYRWRRANRAGAADGAAPARPE
jgi:hypothetical protein